MSEGDEDYNVFFFSGDTRMGGVIHVSYAYEAGHTRMGLLPGWPRGAQSVCWVAV